MKVPYFYPKILVLILEKTKNGDWHLISTDDPEDSLIILSSLSFGHGRTTDWRIFGYEEPDIHSRRMILISVFQFANLSVSY